MTYPKMRVEQGDITTFQVDAIVNAANPTLLGGGGVDGAIHAAAGPALLEYCRGLGGCPTGEAKITPGFQLPAEYIIHTVGPVWQGGGRGESELLTKAYKNSLELAKEHGLKSIAFPAISTGIYGYPPEQAVLIAVRTAEPFQQEMEIIFVAFDDRTYQLYIDALEGGTE